MNLIAENTGAAGAGAKERPILFSGHMVRALRAARVTANTPKPTQRSINHPQEAHMRMMNQAIEDAAAFTAFRDAMTQRHSDIAADKLPRENENRTQRRARERAERKAERKAANQKVRA